MDKKNDGITDLKERLSEKKVDELRGIARRLKLRRFHLLKKFFGNGHPYTKSARENLARAQIEEKKKRRSEEEKGD